MKFDCYLQFRSNLIKFGLFSIFSATIFAPLALISFPDKFSSWKAHKMLFHLSSESVSTQHKKYFINMCLILFKPRPCGIIGENLRFLPSVSPAFNSFKPFIGVYRAWLLISQRPYRGSIHFLMLGFKRYVPYILRYIYFQNNVIFLSLWNIEKYTQGKLDTISIIHLELFE